MQASFIVLFLVKTIVADEVLIADPIKVIDLQKWTISVDGEDDANTTFEVSRTPNGIFTVALWESEILQDLGENSSRWISEQNWKFTTELTDADIFSQNNIILVLEGIDTVAEVKLNNVSLGKTENMFVQYQFDIKNHLKKGSNLLEIIIESPLQAANDASQNSSYDIPRDCPPSFYNGDCHINMLRKMQSAFSSSFGLSLPSEGIWRPARAIGYQESYIQHVIAEVEDLNETFWKVNMNVYLANNKLNDHIYGRMNLIFDGNSLGNQGYWWLNVTCNEYGENIWTNSIDVEKSSVELWWPNQYGAQKLYNLTVQYYTSDIQQGHQVTVRLGFRTVELVQEGMGNGLTFYFKVNDVPIFMKGSNLVPLSIIPENIEIEGTARKLLQDAADSSMNMLRIYGGGTYGPDYLYDVADELGLLIWQDFMFADSLYPANDEFLNNTLNEVRYQVKRIYGHPSLALFCGNFRIEQALSENWFDLGNKTVYENDYVKLFVDTIQQEHNRITHDNGIFIVSSPGNGEESGGDISSNPNDELFGDVQYFNFTADPFDYTKYPIPRFISAYGQQSLPSVETLLQELTSNYYLDVNGTILIYRQHQSEGYKEMQNLIESNFVLPMLNDSYYFISFVFYSEIIQAHSLKLQTEHYRSYKGIVNADSRGHTMGTLMWHLNDVWSAPTFSGIDFAGRWKLAQYYIRDAFAPVIVTGKISGTNLDIYVVSDLLETHRATLKMHVYKWSSFNAVNESEILLDVIPNTSSLVVTYNITEISNYTGCTRETCFYHLTLESDGNSLAPNNFVLPAALKDCDLPIHYILVTTIRKLEYQPHIYEVTIRAEALAVFVFVDSHFISGKFSENGFLMVTPTKTVYFYAEQDTTEADLMKMIRVTHLRDMSYTFFDEEL